MADHFSEYDAFNVPPEFKPVGTIGYIGYSFLFAIPVIGWIFMIIFSFSDANINRRNYARFHFIFLVLGIISLLVLFFLGTLNEPIAQMQQGNWQMAVRLLFSLG